MITNENFEAILFILWGGIWARYDVSTLFRTRC